MQLMQRVHVHWSAGSKGRAHVELGDAVAHDGQEAEKQRRAQARRRQLLRQRIQVQRGAALCMKCKRWASEHRNRAAWVRGRKGSRATRVQQAGRQAAAAGAYRPGAPPACGRHQRP